MFLVLDCSEHCDCKYRLWQEQVDQFFHLKAEERSWSLLLELEVWSIASVSYIICLTLVELFICMGIFNALALILLLGGFP